MGEVGACLHIQSALIVCQDDAFTISIYLELIIMPHISDMASVICLIDTANDARPLVAVYACQSYKMKSQLLSSLSLAVIGALADQNDIDILCTILCKR